MNPDAQLPASAWELQASKFFTIRMMNQSHLKITRYFLRVRVMRMLMHRAVARVAAVAARRPRAAALMILATCGRFTDARIAVSAQADGTEQHHNCYRCHSESAHVLLPICLARLGCARRRLLGSLRLRLR